MAMAARGRHVPLERLCWDCGVTREAATGAALAQVARRYGFEAEAIEQPPERIFSGVMPAVVGWRPDRFLVVEGCRRGTVWVNDPAGGPRSMRWDAFAAGYSGTMLSLRRGEAFDGNKDCPGLVRGLVGRFAGAYSALLYVAIAGLLLVIPGILVPAFARVYIDNILVADNHEWFVPLMIAMGLVLVFNGVLFALQEYCLLRLELRLALTGACRSLWHALCLPLRYFEHRSAGEMAGRVQLNDEVAALAGRQLAGLAWCAFAIIVYLAVMFLYDPFLALVCAMLCFADYLLLQLAGRRRVRANRRLLERRGAIQGLGAAGLQMIETLKATASERHLFDRWTSAQAAVLEAEQSLGLMIQGMYLFPALLMGLCMAVVVGVGGMKIVAGQMTVGGLVAFQSLLMSMMAPLTGIVNAGAVLQDLKSNMRCLDNILWHPQDEGLASSGAEDSGRADSGKRLEGRIELRNVSFGYNPVRPPLIDRLNLAVPPGGRVAIVGDSGSGKSTVSRLLAGLCQPWDGEVRFDGAPRAAWPRGVLVRSIEMVDQDIFLFSGTVRDNLTLWNDAVCEADMIRACQDAMIHDALVARPGGYDGPVGEGGNNFSGGQRQQIEIARALARNPSVLILDEATSALDPLLESQVYQNIARRGCTCVIVAHRLNSIRDADQIIVLDQGQAVERGTHEALRRLNGRYARLIRG
jgi:NHLM bacteriocin system ABC transporter peptidase/ATP-binding protein